MLRIYYVSSVIILIESRQRALSPIIKSEMMKITMVCRMFTAWFLLVANGCLVSFDPRVWKLAV